MLKQRFNRAFLAISGLFFQFSIIGQYPCLALSELSPQWEGQLIRLSCISFEKAGGVFSAPGDYYIVDESGAYDHFYLPPDHPMLGEAIPSGNFVLTGLLRQQSRGMRITPRDRSDLQAAPCLYFVKRPRQTRIDTQSIQLEWETNAYADIRLRYGASADPMNDVELPAGTTSYTISGLQPGSIYWAEVIARYKGESLSAGRTAFGTQSESSGQIKTWFNRGLAKSSVKPAGKSPEEMILSILEKINTAEKTLDVYISENDRPELRRALDDAFLRGVRIRYIAAQNGKNSALQPEPSFPLFYGPDLTRTDLQFVVKDADYSDKSWIMFGGLPWTEQCFYKNFNRLLWIQDQTLARAFALEFEEMWGGSGDLPDPKSARFGRAKKVNTPELFMVGNRPVSLHFSPSDRLYEGLNTSITGAQKQLLLAMPRFSDVRLSQSVLVPHNRGVPVHGIIDVQNESAAVFSDLKAQGIELLKHENKIAFGKPYALIDGTVIITGGQTWTAAEAFEKEEALLSIRDEETAELFRAEFEKRRQEVFVPAIEPPRVAPVMFGPNPAVNFVDAYCILNATYEIKDEQGKAHLNGSLEYGIRKRIDVKHLPAGNYWMIFKTIDSVVSFPFQKV